MDNLQFVLVDLSGALVQAWNDEFAKLPQDTRDKFTMVTSDLVSLETPHNEFDCIVSPANSYGRLDGGFDYALAEAIAPPDDILAATRHTQSVLYDLWKGFAPPGTCTLIPLAGSSCEPNKHGCSYIALCPTMRIPESITWNREIVYNLMWSLLVTLDRHNKTVVASGTGIPIRKVVMTGFGTGAGFISPARCAKQMSLAVENYMEACSEPQKWSTLEWSTATAYAKQARRTYV